MLTTFPPRDNEHIRVIGIDPGTDTLGIAALDIHAITFEVKVVKAITLKASKDITSSNIMAELTAPCYTRLASLKINLGNYISEASPNFVVSEAPFFRRGMLSAYKALVECIMMITNTLWEWKTSTKLYMVDPVGVKNAVGVSHIKTEKDDVRDAVLKLYKDKHNEDVNLEELDEHSIDAIAVATHFIRTELFGEDIASTRKKRNRKRKKRKKSKE